MIQSVEKQGRTVEEAIQAALEELQVERDAVEIEVLEEASKGFLGLLGGKPARVLVTVTPDPQQITTDFLLGIGQRLGVKISVQMNEDDETIRYDIDGDNLGLLIGKHGNTLESLQYLASIVYNRHAAANRRLLLDVGGYRQRREETLRRLATRLAEKAKRTGRRVMLEPMSAHERRIIHTTLQGDRQIVTYSEGDEPYRKVVISLR